MESFKAKNEKTQTYIKQWQQNRTSQTPNLQNYIKFLTFTVGRGRKDFYF